ncbi:MAG: hypothetical protein AAF226_02205 [Verrucomicrobiota bacterium]
MKAIIQSWLARQILKSAGFLAAGIVSYEQAQHAAALISAIAILLLDVLWSYLAKQLREKVGD